MLKQNYKGTKKTSHGKVSLKIPFGYRIHINLTGVIKCLPNSKSYQRSKIISECHLRAKKWPSEGKAVGRREWVRKKGKSRQKGEVRFRDTGKRSKRKSQNHYLKRVYIICNRFVL